MKIPLFENHNKPNTISVIFILVLELGLVSINYVA